MAEDKKSKNIFKITPMDKNLNDNKTVRFMNTAELASLAPNTIRT